MADTYRKSTTVLDSNHACLSFFGLSKGSFGVVLDTKYCSVNVSVSMHPKRVWIFQAPIAWDTQRNF